MDNALDKLKLASKKIKYKDLYLEFENIIKNNNYNDISEDILIFLKDIDNKIKCTLLSCMADHDFVLKDNLLKEIIKLLYNKNIDIIRSAALALNFGGDESKNSLYKELDYLNDVVKKDIYGLLNLVH